MGVESASIPISADRRTSLSKESWWHGTPSTNTRDPMYSEDMMFSPSALLMSDREGLQAEWRTRICRSVRRAALFESAGESERHDFVSALPHTVILEPSYQIEVRRRNRQGCQQKGWPAA